MKHRIITILLPTLLVAVLATACRREESAPSDVPETPVQTDATTAEAEKIAGTDANTVTEITPAESGVQPVEDMIAGVPKKDFAGTFAADGIRIALAGDGTYGMTVRAQSAGADLESDGTWALEPDGKHLLLDPNSKDEADRRYALASADELKADDGGQVLRREGAR